MGSTPVPLIKDEDRHFYIVSPSERGFWSNEKGWVFGMEDADSFTFKEVKEGLALPVSKDHDAFIFEATEILAKGDTLKFNEEDDDDQPLRVLGDRSAIEAAHAEHNCDGETEIDQPPDDDAECEKAVSRGADNGIYVKAWVWIYWPKEELEPVKL